MREMFGIRLGGLQRKTVIMMLAMLFVTIAVVTLVVGYQNRMLAEVVGETRVEQQQAISRSSQDTMHQVMQNTLVSSTAMQARIADNDFAEIVRNAYMLQTMAQNLLAMRDSVTPAAIAPPDPANDGKPAAAVLCEAGVDYTKSEYLGAVAHMADPMIAMLANSDKIESCYIGLADGTHLDIDTIASNKYDKNGKLIPYPVRQRPWYLGALQAGGLYFTGVVADAFTGKLGVTCSVPVIVNGKTLGVAGIDIVLDKMTDFIKTSDSNSFAMIVNSDGQVLLAPENNGLFELATTGRAPDLRLSENRKLGRFVQNALTEQTELTVVPINGREYYMAGAPMPTVGWTVISVVAKDLTEQPERLLLAEYESINDKASARFRSGSEKVQRTSLLILGGLVAVCVAIALLSAGRIAKPLEAMADSILESGRTGRMFEMRDCYRTKDEIEILALAFDDLFQKTRQYIHDITEITKEKERVNTELSLASRIQSSMLPHIFPAFPNRHEFDIYATMDPAKEVGGDFYDFFLIDDDHLCMVIADVSGKGVPAALFMMISKVILQNSAKLSQSPAEILRMANTALCSGNSVEMFVTVWLGILQISTGKIVAANAGHEYPALMRGEDFSLMKDKHSFVVGGMSDVRYKEYELQMNPGDRLFCYTDGVPEATNAEGKMFGTERMLAALNRAPVSAPDVILGNVRRAVDEFVQDAEQFDDLTMLCFEYKGTQNS